MKHLKQKIVKHQLKAQSKVDYKYNQNIIEVQVVIVRHLPLTGSARTLLRLQLT